MAATSYSFVWSFWSAISVRSFTLRIPWKSCIVLDKIYHDKIEEGRSIEGEKLKRDGYEMIQNVKGMIKTIIITKKNASRLEKCKYSNDCKGGCKSS